MGASGTRRPSGHDAGMRDTFPSVAGTGAAPAWAAARGSFQVGQDVLDNGEGGLFLCNQKYKEMIELKYFPLLKGAYGNLMFIGKSFPMKNGKFPKDHPFAPMDNMDNYPSIGVSEKLESLRKLGYYVSCFPEGDGLCFSHSFQKSQQEVIDEISRTLNAKLIYEKH